MVEPSADPLPIPDGPSASPGSPVTTPVAARNGRRRPVLVIAAIFALAIVGLAVSQAGLLDRRSGPTSTTPRQTQGAGPGSIAWVDNLGALKRTDSLGTTIVLGAESDTTYGFPAWSPDGTRVAAVRDGPRGTEIAIFPVSPASAGAPPSAGPGPSAAAGSVIFRSPSAAPFYLYWSPDGRTVSFLANEDGGITLRSTPTDGSSPLDGGPAGLLRNGAPLYFDWMAPDRLLLHVGIGPDAFLGEVGPDGSGVGAAIANPGDFRTAAVSPGGQFRAWVRGSQPTASIVVSRRDGSAEHELAVFGPAAFAFNDAGTTLAAIGADQPGQANLAFPLGPLRLIDPSSGVERTLLDGRVVGFFWSPDGRTIAALRLVGGPAGPVADASPTPAAAVTVHLVFVDVGDGHVRSDQVVRPASRFVGQFLPYFDQYALSHRIWAADSSALLLPVASNSGTDELLALPPDGAEPLRRLAGDAGFWSP